MEDRSEIVRVLTVALSVVLAVSSTACGPTVTSTRPSDSTDSTDSTDAATPGLCGETIASCPSDRCDGSHCALNELADLGNLRLPRVVGADGEYVYLASDSGLYRVPRCGGPAETLALSTVPFELVEVEGESVFFHFAQPPGSVVRMPRAGGASQELNPNADSSPSSVVAVQPVGADVYVVTGADLSVLPVNGGPFQSLLEGYGIGDLAGDDEYVYFHQISASGNGLYRTKRGNLAPELLLDTADSSEGMSAPAVDDDAVYIAYRVASTVDLHRVAKSTGSGTVVATLDAVPGQIESDGRCVYVAFDEMTSGNGYRSLHRMPVAGGASELLASNALGFALDDTAYYFSTGGYLFRSPK